VCIQTVLPQAANIDPAKAVRLNAHDDGLNTKGNSMSSRHTWFTALQIKKRDGLRRAAQSALFAAVAALGIVQAAHAATAEEIKARGYLSVATEDDFKPFEFVDNGKPTGYDNEMLALVKKKTMISAATAVPASTVTGNISGTNNARRAASTAKGSRKPSKCQLANRKKLLSSASMTRACCGAIW